jgi:hypothetical protein
MQLLQLNCGTAAVSPAGNQALAQVVSAIA